MDNEAIARIEERLERIEKMLSAQRSGVQMSMMGVEEVALYTGYSKRYIYNLTRDKKIPHYKRGEKVLFKKEEIDQWLTETRVSTDSELLQKATNYCISQQ